MQETVKNRTAEIVKNKGEIKNCDHLVYKRPHGIYK